MVGITSKRRVAIVRVVLAFVYVLAAPLVGVAPHLSMGADGAIDKIRATWERLANRVKNLRLELEGEQTILVPKVPSEPEWLDPDELEPKRVPFAIRVLVKFPKIYVEENGRDFSVRRNRIFFYAYTDVHYCDGSRLWALYTPKGPGQLPQFRTWPSLRTFAKTKNYFFGEVAIELLTALLCAPTYQQSDVAPLWRAMCLPWDRAEPGVWEGREVYRVSESKEAFTIAFVTREPPHACLAIEYWMRGGFEDLLSRSTFRWSRVDDWPLGLSGYEYVDRDGKRVKLQVKRLEIGTVTDTDFPSRPPRLRPGTWLIEFEDPPPGEQIAARDYLWISDDHRIPDESLPPDFLERLAAGEATLDELTGGPPKPIWPIVVGVACAIAILASVGRWAYKRIRARSTG